MRRDSKAHMDQALAQAKLTVSATSPVWEPQRAFERRLNNIMTKGKGTPHPLPLPSSLPHTHEQVVPEGAGKPNPQQTQQQQTKNNPDNPKPRSSMTSRPPLHPSLVRARVQSVTPAHVNPPLHRPNQTKMPSLNPVRLRGPRARILPLGRPELGPSRRIRRPGVAGHVRLEMRTRRGMRIARLRLERRVRGNVRGRKRRKRS